jgi:hypothetical protein
MARYYFDVINGNRREPDEQGLELSDLDDVRREAGRILTDIAKFEIDHVEELTVGVSVRDSVGRLIHHGDLSFRTQTGSLDVEAHPEDGDLVAEANAV